MIINRIKKMDPLCVVQGDPARTGLTATAYLDSSSLVGAARAMLDEGYHLEDVSALHVREGFLISYFFGHTQTSGRIALRALTPNEAPNVPSITSVYPGADWHEREANDFYGIRFEGHPNPVRLLLPSDMDTYPLRKEEPARASIRALFSCAPETVIMKREGFTLFDPEPESTGEEPRADRIGDAISKD